jgi:hypothetical protein
MYIILLYGFCNDFVKLLLSRENNLLSISSEEKMIIKWVCQFSHHWPCSRLSRVLTRRRSNSPWPFLLYYCFYCSYCYRSLLFTVLHLALPPLQTVLLLRFSTLVHKYYLCSTVVHKYYYAVLYYMQYFRYIEYSVLHLVVRCLFWP